MQLHDFKSVALNYRAIFFDAYGVLKNHKGLIPGVDLMFQFLRENDIDFYILTNDASRSPMALAAVYQEKGIPEINEHKIISSGMIAREYLRLKVKSGVIAYLGTPQSAHYVEAIGLKTISIRDLELEQADKISALVLLDDEGFDWNHDINKAINLVRIKNMPVIVANTDSAYPVSKHELAVAVGSIANMIEHIVGKKFIRFGKPDAQMFNFAYEHIQKDLRPIQKNEILMVGDTLHTDILGGNKFGIDTALVLSGNTLPHRAEVLIEAYGIIPNYICDSVAINE
ncbi:MAG: HAD-IIA family hydrolase [Bacteroidia bacterium]